MPSKRSTAPQVCEWWSLDRTFRGIADFVGKTESAEHIKPLHWYIACRLVVEGGFLPDEVTPHPPFHAERRGKRPPRLRYDAKSAGGGEQVVYGGLKTKNVDVVVTKPTLGPVLAISLKGMQGAFRNLTNRLEEMVGECTNLHITYPALTLGYLLVLNGNRPGSRRSNINDLAFDREGEPIPSIIRIHYALSQLHGRSGVRDHVSKYEATSLAVIETVGGKAGTLTEAYPPPNSPLRFERFLETLYAQYDERFVYGAPLLVRRGLTLRQLWSPDSPIFADESTRGLISGYEPRIAADPSQPIVEDSGWEDLGSSRP